MSLNRPTGRKAVQDQPHRQVGRLEDLTSDESGGIRDVNGWLRFESEDRAVVEDGLVKEYPGFRQRHMVDPDEVPLGAAGTGELGDPRRLPVLASGGEVGPRSVRGLKTHEQLLIGQR